METMARRTKEEAEQTRMMILRASLDLFCEKGYSKTTFDEIAKRINLTKGAVYWHFRNKPDLLIALIKEVIIKVNAYLSKKITQINNLNDLKAYFLYNAELIKEHPIFRKFMFFAIYQMEWSESIYEKTNKSLENILDFPLKQIKETLTKMQKSKEIASEVNVNEISEIFFCFWKSAIGKEIVKESPEDFLSFVSKGFDIIIGRLKEER